MSMPASNMSDCSSLSVMSSSRLPTKMSFVFDIICFALSLLVGLTCSTGAVSTGVTEVCRLDDAGWAGGCGINEAGWTGGC